jgi:hypothetical protein
MEHRKKGTKPPFFRNNSHGQQAPREPRITGTMGKRQRKPHIQCWGCGEDHMYRDCPHRAKKVKIVHSVKQVDMVEDMGINVPRICVALDNKKVELQSHMIEVEGKINNQPIFLLIDLGASHSYLDPKMVGRFQFPTSKLEKP